MLSEEETEKIIKNSAVIYPNSKGIMLTGSQLNNDKINEHHDVDIIIFDSQFSVVSPFSLVIDNIRYDFTQFPYTDIPNILLNEFADPRGTLLSMLVKATILKDSENQILQAVQIIAKNYYEQINPTNYEDFHASLRELVKMRKDMDRENDHHRRFFLVIEFAAVITNAELIKLTKWNNLGKHKADFLKESNPDFVNKISSLVEDAIGDNTAALSPIGTYIDYYVSLPATYHSPSLKKRKLIIDFDYDNFSLESFILDLLPLLNNDQRTKEAFQYFYLSPANYKKIYKRKLSVVFKTMEDEDAFEKNFKDLILQKKTNVRTSLLPGYFEVHSAIPQFDLDIEPILIKTSHMVQQSVVINRAFDGNRMVFTAVIILSSLISILELTDDEALNVCKYLLNKYLFTRQEQDKAGNPNNYSQVYKNKYAALNAFTVTNFDVIKLCFEKGNEYERIEHDRPYFLVIDAIQNAIRRCKNNESNQFDEQSITGKILFNDFGILKIKEGIIACIIYENIVKCLLLLPLQGAAAMFSVMRFIANKENIRQKSIEVPL
jgi:hypothetical protein